MMKTETITCDICKKGMDPDGITVTFYAHSSFSDYCLPNSYTRIDICPVCLGKMGIKKEKVNIKKIEDIIREIAYGEAMDVRNGG